MSPKKQKELLNRINFLFVGLITLLSTLILYSYLLNNTPEEISFNKHINISENKQYANLYFIFLNGLGCFSDDSVDHNMGFKEIRSALKEMGFSFYDDRYLLYSYTGGKVDNGKWIPKKYTELDTGQSICLSNERLETMFEEFSYANPRAKFILVGHSLGGRIALDFASTTSPKNKEKIIGLITLNSPLLGAGRKVPYYIIQILSYYNSKYGSTAVKELLWEFQFQKELAGLRRETIEGLQKGGIRIATFSTYQDIFVKPFTGCIADENYIPVSEGTILDISRSRIKDVIGHMAILESPEIINYIMSICLNGSED